MARPIGSGGQAKNLTPDEIKRVDKMLTGTTHELRNRALLYLGLGGGFRIAEMVGLKVVDVKNGKVRDHVVLDGTRTKNGRSRTVFLSEQAQAHLKKYLDSRADLQPEQPLFPSQKDRNKPITANAAVQMLANIFKASGIDHASSHSMRRTHANSLRRNGVDLKIIKEQLGHSSLAVTDRYFSVDPVEAAQAVAGLRF